MLPSYCLHRSRVKETLTSTPSNRLAIPTTNPAIFLPTSNSPSRGLNGRSQKHSLHLLRPRRHRHVSSPRNRWTVDVHAFDFHLVARHTRRFFSTIPRTAQLPQRHLRRRHQAVHPRRMSCQRPPAGFLVLRRWIEILDPTT
jgi:hypothetical protein